MPSLSGFGSLAAISEEKITDKITRRVLAGMMVWWKMGAGTHIGAHRMEFRYLRTAARGFFSRRRADLTAREKLRASRFASGGRTSTYSGSCSRRNTEH